MQGYGSQPPAGQQVIGILNIVFGVLGAIPWLLALLGSSIMAAAGGAVGTSGAEGAPVGGLMAGAGIILAIVSLVGMATSVLLIAGGVGILKMAPWGRTLSLVFAWITIGLNVAQMLMSGFSTVMCNLVGVIYPIVLLVLLNQPDWKSAFGGEAYTSDPAA